jgi:hypothetical protein
VKYAGAGQMGRRHAGRGDRKYAARGKQSRNPERENRYGRRPCRGALDARRNTPRTGFGNLPVRRRGPAPGSTKQSQIPQIRASALHSGAIALKPRAIFFVSLVSQTPSCSGNLA